MAKITYKQHQENMEEFRPYIELLEEADELETMVKELYNFSHPDYTSDQFQQAYFAEIKAQLDWFKENVEIIEEPERKVTQTIRGGKYLKYAD